MGKAVFPWSADSKPFDRSTPNFEKITTVLTSCYQPIFITFASRGLSAQNDEVATFMFTSFFVFSFFFSLLVTILLRKALVDFDAC
jgi:hypothetical protein